MQTYYHILAIINGNLINGSFISVLVIMLANRFLKDRSGIPYAAAIIKWILILGACLTLITLTTELFFSWYSGVQYNQIGNRATGPYWWSYWLTFSFWTLLPLALLFKSLGKRLWFLLAVSMLMNFGWLFERLIIIITSLHRDYIPSSWAMFYPSIYGWVILQGMIVGIIALVLGNLIAKTKAKKLSPLRR